MTSSSDGPVLPRALPSFERLEPDRGKRVVEIQADASQGDRAVSSTLFGLFYEDLNRACDGGLNANVIANHSFDGIYLDRRMHNELIAMTTKRRGRVIRDPGRHWHTTEGTFATMEAGGFAQSARYARLSTRGERAVLRNSGYQPAGERGVATIAAKAGTDMLFSAWIVSEAFDGAASVRLVQPDSTVVGEALLESVGDSAATRGWRRVSASIPVSHTGRVHCELVLKGRGHLDLDEVSLAPADHWGAGDPRWSQGVFRRDLVEVLAALRPTFMRFPGGCVVEGMGGTNAYDWKRTVGPLAQRKADYNLWGLRVPDGDYSQSNQIGYYEFFLLCEDLGMAPMPVVPAGISCQFRSRECIRHDHPDFEQVVQDTLDLIDWATGDPGTSAWAALRAEAGHPEPFPLTYLAIGNENHGPRYFENYVRIRDAVSARNPTIVTVLSAGPFAQGKAFDATWDFVTQQRDQVLVDEHFYKSPSWFTAQANRYDTTPRDRAKVFVGEYAARAVTAKSAPNTFESALAEAAFLTGVERNSDVVAMTSYAPLLNNVGSQMWPHNLIDFAPEAVMPTVNYEVQKLFGSTVGNVIVPVVGDLPDGLFASSTTTDTHQYVKLVNTTDTSLNVCLHVPAVANGDHNLKQLSASPDTANSLGFDGQGSRKLLPVDSCVRVAESHAKIHLPAHSISSLSLHLQ